MIKYIYKHANIYTHIHVCVFKIFYIYCRSVLNIRGGVYRCRQYKSTLHHADCQFYVSSDMKIDCHDVKMTITMQC